MLDTDYCLCCQHRAGTKEPPFDDAICDECRAKMAEGHPLVAAFAVAAAVLILAEWAMALIG